VIKDGQTLKDQAKTELIGEEKVLMMLGHQSIEEPSEVHRAYLETDGKLSVFQWDQTI
jgi:uncharacterized membrane protein YcaP (DUF421 family)